MSLRQQSVTVALTRQEAEAWIRDSRSLDAHVLVRSRGGLKPSGLRAETRAKLARAVRESPDVALALRTALYWMRLGFEGNAQGRAGAGEAEAEVVSALEWFA